MEEIVNTGSLSVWMAFIFYGYVLVSLDLLITGIGLSYGLVELNPYGNIPLLYYAGAFVAISAVYFTTLLLWLRLGEPGPPHNRYWVIVRVG
jgi:hypothetical protein